MLETLSQGKCLDHPEILALGELRGSVRAAHPPGNSLAAAYAARMLGSGIRCPKRPAPPTEAAGSG